MIGCRIAIAGCGPAGLAAALLLARAGHQVSLFDRFPAPRPLGSGLMLQPSGLAVLHALGLGEAIVTRGARIKQLYGLGADGRRVLDARYADLPGRLGFGLGIHRASLFDLLYETVRAEQIATASGHEVVGSHCDHRGRWLQFANQRDAGPFDLLVDAMGLHTPLCPPCGRALPFGALWTTLPWPEHGPFDRNRLEQRYRGASEMIGVLPTGNRDGVGEELALFWSLRTDRYAEWQDRGLTAWRDEMAALWPESAVLAEQITDPAQVTLASYSHRTLPRPTGERLVHVGDAWHTASPQLGQGANMALLDAYAIAEALRLTRDPREAPAMTIQLRRWHIVLYQWVTAFFTPLYQSDDRFPALLRDRFFAPASRFWPGKPIQAYLMSGLLGRPLARLGL